MHKHAYLIIAHNDIPLLEALVSCLDDIRNDIYIHWDLKSGGLPVLKTDFSSLYMIEDRVKVNWAGYSMVEAEYRLFRKALSKGPYAYYHLLSGVDMPIKSQDYIHRECERMAGTEFIGFAPTPQDEIDYRIQHRFLFSEEFRTTNFFKRGLRYVFLKIQDMIHLKRTNITIKKGAQWCSLTNAFVKYLIEHEKEVRQLFCNTFCPDELFIQTMVVNSPFAKNVKTAPSEYDGNMRFIKWKNGELLPINEEDYPALKESERWFARKFSSSDKHLISLVTQLSK